MYHWHSVLSYRGKPTPFLFFQHKDAVFSVLVFGADHGLIMALLFLWMNSENCSVPVFSLLWWDLMILWGFYYSTWVRYHHLKSQGAALFFIFMCSTTIVSTPLSVWQSLVPGRYKMHALVLCLTVISDHHHFLFFSRGTTGLVITLQLKASSFLYVYIFVKPLLF